MFKSSLHMGKTTGVDWKSVARRDNARGLLMPLAEVKQGNSREGLLVATKGYGGYGGTARLLTMSEVYDVCSHPLVNYLSRSIPQKEEPHPMYWFSELEPYSMYSTDQNTFWKYLPKVRVDDLLKPLIHVIPYRIYRDNDGIDVETSVLMFGTGLLDGESGVDVSENQFSKYIDFVLSKMKGLCRNGTIVGTNFAMLNIKASDIDKLFEIKEEWQLSLKQCDNRIGFCPKFAKPNSIFFVPFDINMNCLDRRSQSAIDNSTKAMNYGSSISKEDYASCVSIWRSYANNAEKTYEGIKTAYEKWEGSKQEIEVLNHILGFDYEPKRPRNGVF